MASIFVSYRRNDADESAGRIADAFGHRLGDEHVFMDMDSIPYGAKFVDVLNERLKKCDALIAVIGPKWHTMNGVRRLDNDGDFVRMEVAAALERDIIVVPVLVNKADMPSAENLPDDLKDLAGRNAMPLYPEYWKAALRDLIDKLVAQIEAAAEPAAAAAEAPSRAEAVGETPQKPAAAVEVPQEPPAEEPVAEAPVQPPAEKPRAQMTRPPPAEEPTAQVTAEPVFEVSEEPATERTAEDVAATPNAIIKDAHTAVAGNPPTAPPVTTPDWSAGAEVIIEIQHPAYGRRGRGSRQISCVAFSPDGSRLATASSDCSARVWDIESGRELRNMLHTQTISAVAFSADGQMLATAGEDDVAAVWEIGSGDLPADEQAEIFAVAQITHKRDVDAVSFRQSDLGPEGRTQIVSATRDHVWLWEIAVDADVLEAAELDLLIRGRVLAISTDGRLIVGGDSFGVARVWQVDDGRAVIDVKHPVSMLTVLNAVAISPDATSIATAGAKTARVWAIDTGSEQCCVHHVSEVYHVAFSPDGRQIATASDDSTAAIWDASTGAQIVSLPHDTWVRHVAFSPDGRRLATAGSDDIVRVWEITA
jgi:hypothetical protein